MKCLSRRPSQTHSRARRARKKDTRICEREKKIKRFPARVAAVPRAVEKCALLISMHAEIREMDITNVAFQNRFTTSESSSVYDTLSKEERENIRHRTPAAFYLMEEEVEDTECYTCALHNPLCVLS